MIDAGALTTWIDALRDTGVPVGDWPIREEDSAFLSAAWVVSDDPFAMMLLLAALYPKRIEPRCEAMVAALSFWPPMTRLAEMQAVSRPGMNYNGPDNFMFVRLAQRVRGGLRELSQQERMLLSNRLAQAMRVVVSNPVRWHCASP